MKIPAAMALGLALIVGGWSVNDYFSNESYNQSVHEQRWKMASSIGSGDFDRKIDENNREIERIEDKERGDGYMGVFAMAVLIGSIALFLAHRQASNSTH